MKRILCTTGLAFGLASTVLAAPTVAQEATTATVSVGKQARIAGLVRGMMRSQRVRGASVAVAVNGVIVYATGLGEARKGKAAAKDTIYPIGEITQQLTAGLLLLWQQRRYRSAGKVRVNDPLTEYFFGVTHWSGTKLAHLLTHSSGLPQLTESIFYQERLYSNSTTDKILQFIKGREPGFKPGSKFRFSHSNYFMVAQVIEIGLELYYHDYMKLEIYNQAKMSRSSFLSRQTIGGRAQGYVKGKHAQEVNPSIFFGSADATSTVLDLMKWNFVILRSKMFTKLSRETLFGKFIKTGPGLWYGAGFFVRPGAGFNEYFTVGNIPGYSGVNKILHNPATGDDIYVAILTNGDKVKGLDRLSSLVARAAR